METALIVGTSKGAAIFRSTDRKTWSFDGLALPGWKVTASTRDVSGRTYLGVSQDIYGTAIVVSDDLKTWRQLENGPAYAKGVRGNELHNRIAGAEVPIGDFDTSQRHIDQIWKLHAVRDEIYAGVSEAGLFCSKDRGETWQPLSGLNDHPSRANWEPGAGGLCAHTFLADERNPDRMWVGISAAGVFRTDDGGKTWIPKNDGISRSSGICVHSLAHDPKIPDVIYRQDHRGVYVTQDGGDTWSVAEEGLPICKLSDDHECAFGFASAFDVASGTAFVIPLDGDGLRFPKDGKLTVYSSDNGADNWTPRRHGLPDNMYDSILRGALAVDKASPGGIYFGTSSGSVFASNDLGENWQEIGARLPRVLSVGAYAL
jgi:hypothetical protein